MKTQLIRLDPGRVAVPDIRRIAIILERGGLMVFPTDTFYGLGADGFSRQAIRRIYALKLRDISKPLLVLVSDVDMVQRLARLISLATGPRNSTDL